MSGNARQDGGRFERGQCRGQYQARPDFRVRGAGSLREVVPCEDRHACIGGDGRQKAQGVFVNEPSFFVLCTLITPMVSHPDLIGMPR